MDLGQENRNLENRNRLDRLVAAFRAQVAAALASGRNGEIHAVADIQNGTLTANSHVTPAREYPLKPTKA